MVEKVVALVIGVLVNLVAGNLFHGLNVRQSNIEDGKLRGGIQTILRENEENNMVKKNEEYATKAELDELDARLSGEIEKVSNDVAALSAMLDLFMYDTQTEFQRVDTELDQIRTESSNQGAAITKLQAVPVNFYAYDYSRKHPNKNEVIKMSEVRSNVGNGYSTETGKFKCPVSGLYQFSFGCYGGSILRVDWAGYHQVGVNLMKGGEKVNLGSTTIYLVGKEGEEWSNLSGSNSAVVQCNSGEELWLASPEFANQGTNRLDQVNFSGFLIRENP